jgi:hypothetical protein
MAEPNPPAPVSPVDTVIEAARADLERRKAAAGERAARIRSAVDAYLMASEGELAAEFAAKVGIAFALEGTARERALSLFNEVRALPELRQEPSPDVSLLAPRAVPEALSGPPSASALPAVELPAPRASAETPPHPARGVGVTEPLAPRPTIIAEPSPPPRTVIVAEPSPPPRTVIVAEPPAPRDYAAERALEQAVAALIDTAKGLNFTSMPVGLFRAWAEELAAEARLLQEQGCDKEATGYVIRLLTRCAYDKGVRDVRGLNHRDSADWKAVAERARTRRALLQGNGARALTQRLDIPETVRQQVALTQPAEPAAPAPPPPAPEAAAEEPEEEEAPAPLVADLPMLRASIDRGPIVLIGGIVKTEKLDLIRQRFGLSVEWVDTSRMGTGTVATLEKRIREHRLAALVLLDGLLGHKHFEPLIAAARQVGLPHAYGGRAGSGSLLRAFREIEGVLSKQSPASPAQPAA